MSPEKTCSVCSSTDSIDEHHLIPQAYGGARGPTVDLCANCHALVHKAARNPRALRDVGNVAARRQIAELAGIAARAARAVGNDPNKSVQYSDRMPAELASKAKQLAAVHGCSIREAVRIAIRSEHQRWFGHSRGLRESA